VPDSRIQDPGSRICNVFYYSSRHTTDISSIHVSGGALLLTLTLTVFNAAMKYLHDILTYRPCVALIETYPWYVSDVLVWNASPSASNGSFIYFHILDTNMGLEFGTSCESSIPPKTGTAHGWQHCEHDNVSFRYQHHSIQIRRSSLMTGTY
jgi:hypothetical protein